MTEEQNFPVALDAPDDDVTPMTLKMVGRLLAMSRESPRLRMLQKIHKSHDSGVQRMFNALQPGTYIMPHRHLHPRKEETLMVVAGSLLFVEFSDQGVVTDTLLLQPGTENFGVDVAPHVYHTYIPLKSDTLMFEIKDGPYSATDDKDVPDWAPREGAPEAEPYLLNLIKDLAERANAAAEEARTAEQQDPGE